jgi:hypothetical protein
MSRTRPLSDRAKFVLLWAAYGGRMLCPTDFPPHSVEHPQGTMERPYGIEMTVVRGLERRGFLRETGRLFEITCAGRRAIGFDLVWHETTASLRGVPMPTGLPINLPAMEHVLRAELEVRGVTFEDNIAHDDGFWFWTHTDRTWAVGPYRQRRSAARARERFLQLADGPMIRVWAV